MNTNQTLITIEGRATYERILSLASSQDTSEAIRQIKNFLLVYPDYAQAHNDLAVLFYHDGNSLKALAHYEKAHKLDPNNITYRKNLADFYFVELDWPDDAIHTYLGILKDNPFDVETLNALGTICAQAGRREQARQYFTRTLQVDTINSQARQALQQLGGELPAPPQPVQIAGPTSQPPVESTVAMQQSPAVPITNAPISQETPQSPEQLHRLALELANSGKTSEAIRALEDLVQRHPTHAAAHNDLGVLCQQAGDLSRARSHQEEALRLQPDNLNFQKNMADLLFIACGEIEEALKLYVKILEGNPREIETLKAISQICLEAGKPDDASSFLENILKIEPWNREARESLDAISDLETKLHSSPSAGRSADEMYSDVQELVRQNHLSEAHSLIEKLVQQYPDHALGHNDLGVLCYRLGDIEGARSAYERAVELQPANCNFCKNLADLYFAELDRTEDAIRIYLDLFRLKPRDFETLVGLGQISASVGRPEEAKLFYSQALEIEPWNAELRGALQALI